MDPLTLATLAVAALARYAGRKAAGVAGRAGHDLDQAVDDRLDRLYATVRDRLAGDDRSERTLAALADQPDDQRRQGRLEATLEDTIAADPEFGARLAAILEDLARRPPAGGVVVQDAGAVALGGNVTMEGRNVAGRDLTIGRDERG